MAEQQPPSPGDRLELQVGGWAHGGHCVARHEGFVVFVRHALPGERVLAEVLDVRRSLARADAIEILRASPDRVEPPCRFAGPGGCGGCDLQHVALPAQREAKTAVVIEQLTRLGRLAGDHRLGGETATLADLGVEAVPGDLDGLGWRTRVQFAVDDVGRAGLRRHRSHEVVDLDRCLLAHPALDELGLTRQLWPGLEQVEGIVSGQGDRLVLQTPVPDTNSGSISGSNSGSRSGSRSGRRRPAGKPPRPGRVRELVPTVNGPVTLAVTGSGFWQVHPGAAAALSEAVVDQLGPRPGDRVFDLYGGVGLFSAVLAPLVAPDGSVVHVEADRSAVADARRNLAGLGVQIEPGRVERVLPRLPRPDLVVLDPPRAGAGATVLQALAQTRPRRISYVACDLAALARDTATLASLGYRLDRLRAFDLFPMTHHVECVARFVPVD